MARSFDISKQLVWQAYKQVKANKGSAGIDGQTIEDFEQNLKGNLYKIWNRMSSGSYFPLAVKAVRIPKRAGGTRTLGIPSISDRIAQTVVKLKLEPVLEPCFHPDSYGYRPGKSAIQAVAVTRERCWKHGWVFEFDIKGAFDNIDHTLLTLALKKHTDCEWVLLYIDRWLKAPMQHSDGVLEERTRGTPQGGVVSPLLMNLFMHYVFDKWMAAHEERRFRECHLELHPEKSKIVCCKANVPWIDYPVTKFDFLGYEFRLRMAVNRKGQKFVRFMPAISPSSAKAIRREIRSWKIQNRSDKSIDDLSRMFGAKLRGWVNYFGHFYKSALYPTFYNLNRKLVKWATRKFKKLRRRPRRAHYWLGSVAKRQPGLFPHWKLLGLRPAIGITGAG
ncbi:MAG TPA: group II intron reverse transcriptase/maturase [Gammaproteobacteria bacterium]|nr:group II intron reverse transcriptase/maturase [Gammaproteobacteria bacterium]